MVFGHGFECYIHTHFLEYRVLHTLSNGFRVEECLECGADGPILVLIRSARGYHMRDGPLTRTPFLKCHIDHIRSAHVHKTLLVQPCGPVGPETIYRSFNAKPFFGSHQNHARWYIALLVQLV